MPRKPTGFHYCGMPSERNNGAPCKQRVGNDQGKDAVCPQHDETFELDVEVQNLVNALTAPMFTYRMSRAQIERRDSQGMRMRHATRTAEKGIRDAVAAYSGFGDEAYIPVARVPKRFRAIPNTNRAVDSNGTMWVRLEAADAVVRQVRREGMIRALDDAADAIPTGAVTSMWLRQRALSLKNGG